MAEHKFKRLNDNPGAVVNTDKTAAEAYRLRKNQNLRINMIEEKVSRVENLLEAILDKLNEVR
jgi:hypothetical protein